MEVLYWQLFVLVSVIVVYLVWGRKAALFLCVGWTAWSFAMIYATPLALIQTFVAWVTWFVCRGFAGSTSSIRDLTEQATAREVALAKSSERVRELEAVLRVVNAPDRFARAMSSNSVRATETSWTLINGREHIPILIDGLNSAAKSICITSGWLGTAVTDRSVYDALCGALNRRVDIFLGYGFGGPSGEHQPQASTEHALELLGSAIPKFDFMHQWGNLVVGLYPNHEKIVVKDEDYIIVGSYNWLSNLRGKNMEASILLFDTELARDEGRRIKGAVIQNAQLFNGQRVEKGTGAFGQCPRCAVVISTIPTACGFWDDDDAGGRIWCATCAKCGASLSTDGGSRLGVVTGAWTIVS